MLTLKKLKKKKTSGMSMQCNVHCRHPIFCQYDLGLYSPIATNKGPITNIMAKKYIKIKKKKSIY